MSVSNGDAGDTGGSGIFDNLNINGLVSSGVQAFGIYETAETAKKAVSKFNSKDLLYVLLGLGGLAVVGVLVFKH